MPIKTVSHSFFTRYQLRREGENMGEIYYITGYNKFLSTTMDAIPRGFRGLTDQLACNN